MQHVLDRIVSRMRGLVSRGRVVSTTLNPKRALLQLSGLAEETKTKIELLLPFGMSAFPSGGEDVVLLQVGGSRSHLLALFADSSALRIADLAKGEFGFRDGNGQQIVFRSDRIEITTPKKMVVNVTGDVEMTVGGKVDLTVTGKVTGSAEEWDLTGDVKVDGDIIATGDIADGVRSMADDRGKYDAHKHGGVQTGSGETGLPTVTE